MADGVNTGGFVPTQPAIVDTSAAFTRLLNIAQRQQERDTAMQLAEQQRLQKQMEAQLDIINGFDSSKMVADDRMMFNDAVNQLRMDFVEGRITDPMQFRGRVAKLRNYYGQFTQYAQNPETLAARDNMMKISYYPSELNKANEQLGAGVEYVAGQDIYNDRVNAFEHPLGGASYQITPQGDILVGTPQGNIPVDSLPRQGAQLFVPGLNYTGRGLTIDSMADEAYVLREINAASNLGKYADRSFEGQAMLGSQGGRAAQIGSYTDDRGGFASYPDIEQLHITGGRTAVRDLIEQTRSTDPDRATAMQQTYDDFLTYAQDEWRKSVLARRPKDTTRPTQGALDRQNFLSNYGFSDMQGTVYSAVRGVDMKNVMVRDPQTQEYSPMNLLSIGVDNNGLVFAEAVPSEGGASQLVNLSSYPENYQMVNQMLLDDKKVGLDELVRMHTGKVPTPEGLRGVLAPEVVEEPAVTFPFQNAAPQPEEVAVPSEEVVPPTVAPEAIDTGVEMTARPGTGEYNVQKRNEENRREAIEDPESLKLKVREDYNISPLVTRTPEDKVFRDNLRNLLDDAGFQNALVQSGYVDFRGVLGDISGESRDKAMMEALDTMGDDERAIYVKQFIQTNKDRF